MLMISLKSTRRIIGTATAVVSATVAATAAHAGTQQYRLLPAYDKVVVVMMENQQASTIKGSPNAPYFNWLALHGAYISESWGCEHSSQPNYFDLFAGEDENVYGDGVPATNPFSADNLGAELLHHGLSFAGFSEDLPYVGDNTDATANDPADPAGTADYARKHNPWADWQNDAYPASIGNLGSNYLPSSVNQPYTTFANIAATGKFDQLPTVSIIVPNQQHDDHGVAGGLSGAPLIQAGDAWLKANINSYAQWALKHNSLLIVTWDEDDYTSINQIPTVFFGADVIQNATFPEYGSLTYTSVINGVGQPSGSPIYRMVHGINHWNILRTIEDIYGLGYAGQSNKVAPVTDVFEPVPAN
jgi:hypothetical protein